MKLKGAQCSKLDPFGAEQLALVPPLPTHHRPVLRRRSRQQTESPFGTTLNAFIDSIDPERTYGP
jgi:hypothetical protein